MSKGKGRADVYAEAGAQADADADIEADGRFVDQPAPVRVGLSLNSKFS